MDTNTQTLWPQSTGMVAKPSPAQPKTSPEAPMSSPPVRKKKAKKMRVELGPYETACSTFERGKERIIEIRVTPAAIFYRVRGLPDEFMLPHAVARLKAISIKADFDTSARKGKVSR